MAYKFELFLVTQKKAYKYKIIRTLSSSDFLLLYRIRYMIRFFMVYLY